MAEPEVVIDPTEGDAADIEMVEEDEGTAENGDEGEPTGLEDIEPTIPERTTFLEYAHPGKASP